MFLNKDTFKVTTGNNWMCIWWGGVILEYLFQHKEEPPSETWIQIHSLLKELDEISESLLIESSFSCDLVSASLRRGWGYFVLKTGGPVFIPPPQLNLAPHQEEPQGSILKGNSTRQSEGPLSLKCTSGHSNFYMWHCLQDLREKTEGNILFLLCLSITCEGNENICKTSQLSVFALNLKRSGNGPGGRETGLKATGGGNRKDSG